jgi:hypothetical protein
MLHMINGDPYIVRDHMRHVLIADALCERDTDPKLDEDDEFRMELEALKTAA